MDIIKKQEFLYDWSIIHIIEPHLFYSFAPIFDKTCYPKEEFASFGGDCAVSLFGRCKEDSRENITTREFADGHRIITTPIIEISDGKATNANTIYILGDMNKDYKTWCEINGINWQEMFGAAI